MATACEPTPKVFSNVTSRASKPVPFTSTMELKNVPPAAAALMLEVITVFSAPEPWKIRRGRSWGTFSRSL